METVLQEAQKITDGIRAVEYGSAKESFSKIAQVASVLCDKELTSIDICRVMQALKLVRQIKKHTRDNLVDACGYLRLESIIQGDEDGKK